MTNKRIAGLLLHPTSLPGRNGIGELGAMAWQTLDWMAQAGFRLWQVLPLSPTGYGDSPYSALSAFAGNPLLISLDLLVEQGWLEENELTELRSLSPERVDYGRVIALKFPLLRKAGERWNNGASDNEREAFHIFIEEKKSWLDDHALYISLKSRFQGRSWILWDEPFRDRHPEAIAQSQKQLKSDTHHEQWLQFQFFQQWKKLHEYAHQLGIQVLGDMPLFVAYDSSDVWASRDLFHLDKAGNPTVVAGVPPDYFSKTGQRWGNPLYHWENHRANQFSWWIARTRAMLDLVDSIRIDHFRGFAACWEIPSAEPTAENGEWVKSPGEELFNAIEAAIGHLPFVAEDLGIITPDVTQLRKKFGLPGMRVMQFAFASGADNPFLPHNHEQDSVVYSGTHDNNTSLGWWYEEADEGIRNRVRSYLGTDQLPANDALIRMAFASVAETAVIPLQDVLGLGSEARMNRPAAERGNWSWRVQQHQFSREKADWMRFLIEMFGRALCNEG